MRPFLAGFVVSRLMLSGVAVAAMALSPAAALAQASDGVLTGKVWQSENQATLKGVIVRIVQTGQTAVTDDQGQYRFGNVAAGDYTLSLSYLGYAPQTQTVKVQGAGVTTLDVALGAQGAAPATLETIVVIGQRGAQASALSQQRAADNTRNVVSADQAGRFPDLNAAESLHRVPGVSVQREPDAGEGRYVSIRGLDSGLNNLQINGFNAAQPEPASRRVPLDLVQTSALSSITVHKTLLPDQDADGIGGAVVLETATAFDYREPVANVTLSGFYHDLANELSPMLQGTVATKFGADDRFGILASVATSKRKTRGYVFFQDEDYLSYVEDDPSSGVTPVENYQSEFNNERENISGNVALNWAVSEATQLVFKASYNRLHDTELVRGLYFALGTDEYDDEGNLIRTEPGSANIFNEYEETELTQESYVLNGVTFAGAFKYDYGIGFSTGKREEPNDNEVGFTRTLESNLLGYDFSGRFPQPNLTASDLAAIGNVDGYVLGSNDIDIDNSKNSRRAVHFDVTYEPSPSWLRMIKAGVKLERSTRTLFEGNLMDLSGPLTLAQFGTGGLVDLSPTGAPYAPFLSLDAARQKDWRRYAQSLIDSNPEFANEYVEDGVIPLDSDSYTSDEDIYASYVMAKGVWDQWEVIGGLRIDHTRVSSDTYEELVLEGSETEFNKIKGEADYTNVLPRLQVNYRLSGDMVLRGAMFTSIARPEPIFISGATEIEEDDGEVDIEYGNPGLKPAYAWNYDLSIERYFGSIGLVSAGVYYKDIRRFIFSEVSPETEGDRERFANDPRLAGKEIDDVTTYTNGKGAQIYGIELNAVRQFPELPGAFGGLGVYANITLQRSKADTGIEGVGDVDFFSAPETLYTAALTYQKYGIESTLAYSWRDRQVAAFSSYLTPIVEEPYGSLDGQLRYALTAKAKLFLNAVDILNEGKDPIVDQRYGEGSNMPQSVTYTGRTATVGIDVSF